MKRFREWWAGYRLHLARTAPGSVGRVPPRPTTVTTPDPPECVCGGTGRGCYCDGTRVLPPEGGNDAAS